MSADPDKAIAGMEKLNAASITESGSVSEAWSKAMQSLTGATGIAIGGVAALGAGMYELASGAAEMGSKIYEAGEKTKMTADALSGLMALSKETGGNFDSLTLSLSRGLRNLTEASDTGKGALVALFSTAELESLKLDSADERIRTVVHRIFELNDVGERNRMLQGFLGRGWQSNLTTLQLLAEQGYAPAIERAKELGTYFDEGAAEKARLFELQVAHMKATWEGLANTLGQHVLPAVSAVFGMIFGSGDEWRIWSDNATVLVMKPFEEVLRFAGTLPAFGEGFKLSAVEMQRAIDNLETDAALTQEKIEARLRAFLPRVQAIGEGIDEALAGC